MVLQHLEFSKLFKIIINIYLMSFVFLNFWSKKCNLHGGKKKKIVPVKIFKLEYLCISLLKIKIENVIHMAKFALNLVNLLGSLSPEREYFLN